METFLNTKMKHFLVSLGASGLLWVLFALAERHSLNTSVEWELYALWAAIVVTALSLGLFAVWLADRMRWKISPYGIFALAVLVAEIGFAVYACYDIATATGFLAGIVGTLIFIAIIPSLAVLQLIDLTVWLVLRHKKRKAGAA